MRDTEREGTGKTLANVEKVRCRYKNIQTEREKLRRRTKRG